MFTAEELNTFDIQEKKIHLLKGTVADLQAENAELRTMLKRLEWAVIAQWGNDRRCPCCLEKKSNGHAESCELAKLIREGIESE